MARKQLDWCGTNTLVAEMVNPMVTNQTQELTLPNPRDVPDANITKHLHNLNKGEAGHGDKEEMDIDRYDFKRDPDQSPRKKKTKKDRKDKKKNKKDK